MTGTKVQIVTIDIEAAGQRIDNFLIKNLKGLPKSRIYRIIRKGEVRINGKRCKAQTRLLSGDQVRIPPIVHLPERSSAVGSFHDLDSLILYEDSHLLVVNKPAGMAVHGGSGVSVGVIESLRHVFPEGNRLELVHRLDRGTSGCLMVAKRRSYLKHLQDALRRPGQIKKRYIAMVHGHWPDQLGRISESLLSSSKTGRERFTRVSSEGKRAITEFQVVARGDDVSMISAFPLTGRTHQIRVHARWARHPLVGDSRYGDEDRDRTISIGARLMLHAAELHIPALGDREALDIMAPIDSLFRSEMRKVVDIDEKYLFKTKG